MSKVLALLDELERANTASGEPVDSIVIEIEAVEQRIAGARAEFESVRKALTEAIQVIRQWHGMGFDKTTEVFVWDVYQQSPEMKRINTVLEMMEGKAKQV